MNKTVASAVSINLKDTNRFTVFTLIALGAYLLFSEQVFASEIGYVLCSVVALVLFDIGRAIATLAIIALGIGALLGKVSWGQGLIVISGIGITMGAPYLALTFTTSVAQLASMAAAAVAHPIAAADGAAALVGCAR
jgi:type IV secretory pathway VirB2 component (pilin)